MPVTFQDQALRVQEHLERFYCIRVLTRDIPGSLIGDLDGAEIHIDTAVTPEERLFLLGHLFGHTVQWNTNPQALEIGRQHRPPVGEDLLPAIIEYESEAAAYALEMFHEIGITSMDQWFSDYTACDQAYLLHYYRTGEKRDFRTFWPDHAPAIQPKPLPRFTPSRRKFRMDGVVI
jgi:hypothetical protein